MGERGRGEGVSEIRSQKSEIETAPYSHPVLTSDFCVLNSAIPLTLYPSPPEGERESQIVAIARSWIGTPYVHQASLKGIGCDCLGLLRGIWRELRGEEPEDVPPYSLDWAEATGVETFYMALRRHAAEISAKDIGPGDIVLFRMLPHGPAKHCGIVASFPPPERGRSIRRADRVGVMLPAPENDPSPDRCAIRPSLFKGGNLALIHSRQNKRVSEEPLSPFWRGKLAFAFRISA
ncbi:MAG: C40 family peptidase [Alphaproteobacteria bacterium]|nr:C40 family peptidase [Alphaproteobacteria bacterium]